MAHIGKLPLLQRFVTSHNEKGEAIVDKSIGTEPSFSSVANGTASFALAYTTSEFPARLSDDQDVKKYQEYLVNPPGLVNSKGTVLRVVV